MVTKFGANEKIPKYKRSDCDPDRAYQGTYEHCKTFKKDKGSQRGLIILVGKRRRLLKYLQRRDLEAYRTLIKELGLRK